MSKVYLLLRHGQQTGPFTIGELLQQQLSPDDMLWVEGKSTAWAYVSELQIIPVLPGEAEKTISTGGDDIERKAEELRQRALSYTPARFPSDHTQVVKHVPVPDGVEPEAIDFIDHRKEKHSALNEVLMTVLILGLFAGGLYGGRTMFIAQKDEHSSRPAQVIAGNTQAASPVSQPRTILTVTDSSSALADSVTQTDSSQLLAQGTTRPPLKKTTVPDLKEKKDTVLNLPLAIKNDPDTGKTVPEPVLVKPVKKEPVKESPKEEVKPEDEDKKKSLGQALKGLFKKKKNREEKDSTSKEKDR
jgi:hypothetical protein